MEQTTIKIDVNTRNALEKSKIHPNQSYNEIIGICLEILRSMDMKEIDKLTKEFRKNG